MALEVFCNLARASDAARDALACEGGVDTYLQFLSDPNWRHSCLTSLNVWLAKDTDRRAALVEAAAPAAAADAAGMAAAAAGGGGDDDDENGSAGVGGSSAAEYVQQGQVGVVERELLKPTAVAQIVDLLRRQGADTPEFEAILQPLLEMLGKSAALNCALGRSPLFVGEIAARLSHRKAIVRTNLLKMLKSLMEHHDDRRELIVRFDLYPRITALAEDKSRVLVSMLADQLLRVANEAMGL